MAEGRQNCVILYSLLLYVLATSCLIYMLVKPGNGISKNRCRNYTARLLLLACCGSIVTAPLVHAYISLLLPARIELFL